MSELWTISDICRVYKISETTLWRIRREAGEDFPATSGRKLRPRFDSNQIRKFMLRLGKVETEAPQLQNEEGAVHV